MSVIEQQKPIQGAELLGQVQRPARGLLGWMNDKQAKLFLSGRQNMPEKPEHVDKIAKARAAIASRSVDLDQTNIMEEPPQEITTHIDSLRQNGRAAAYFAEGWTVKLVDLSKVYAVQPSVFVDHAEERAKDVEPADLNSVAAVSLPVPTQAMLPVQFDHLKGAWVFTSPNPNLRIAGQFGGQVGPDHSGFGFIVEVSPSFLQVALFRGRYLLRDGYHRSYGLLRRGVTKAPVFMREFHTFDDLGLPPGLLPQEAYLGDRPPLLTEYFHPEFSEEAVQVATQRLVVIQGLELNTLG